MGIVSLKIHKSMGGGSLRRSGVGHTGHHHDLFACVFILILIFLFLNK